MPSGPPANHVEPATRNSTSTPAPKPSWIASPRSQNAGLNQLQITARPDIPHKGRPEIFVSFAWGDASSEDGVLPTVVSPGTIWAQVEPGLESEALLANFRETRLVRIDGIAHYSEKLGLSRLTFLSREWP
jgi:hypothetical protein